jgi:hypothetical protein
LAGGNWFVGWGQEPYFSEFSAEGKLLFDAHLPATYQSYTVLKFPWVGDPAKTPQLVLRAGSHGGLLAYVSWNGATAVAQWRLLGGPSARSLTALTTVARNGFETGIAVAHPPAYLAVAALNSSGTVISSSHVVALAGAAKSP